MPVRHRTGQAEHGWPRVRAECHERLREARQWIVGAHGRALLPHISSDSPEWYAQIAAFLLCTPERSGVGLSACDAAALQRRLYDEYRVVVPVIE